MNGYPDGRFASTADKEAELKAVAPLVEFRSRGVMEKLRELAGDTPICIEVVDGYPVGYRMTVRAFVGEVHATPEQCAQELLDHLTARGANTFFSRDPDPKFMRLSGQL